MIRGASVVLLIIAVVSVAIFAGGLNFDQPHSNINVRCPVVQSIQPDGTLRIVDCHGNIPTGDLTATTSPSIRKSSPISNPDNVNLPVDSPASIAYQRYLAAYYDYQTHSLTYAQSVFDWQYKSSIAIFILVILLVLSGLGFAGIQFAIAMRAHRMSVVAPSETTARSGGDDNSSSLVSTLNLSPQGVKVTSSVIGLLILVVSIGFFYLYLVYVYPIQNIAK